MQKPILVTGAHRTGTTFTGKILSLDRNLAYIHEPFNKNNLNGLNSFHVNFWFQYIDETNGKEFRGNFEKILKFDNFVQNVKFRKYSPSSLLSNGHLYYTSIKSKILNKRPLIKDPIALFSAPWLAKSFDLEVVVLIRHPAAFVSSLVNLKWSTDFRDLLNQPLLMDGYLAPFKDEIEKFSKKEYHIIEQSALLWKLLYSTIRQYQIKYPEWIYVKHESLSENPKEEFLKLFQQLDLNYNSRIEAKILDYTSHKIPYSRKYDPGELKRNSVFNENLWQKRLSKEEIKFIRSKVEEVSRNFYSEESWEPEV